MMIIGEMATAGEGALDRVCGPALRVAALLRGLPSVEVFAASPAFKLEEAGFETGYSCGLRDVLPSADFLKPTSCDWLRQLGDGYAREVKWSASTKCGRHILALLRKEGECSIPFGLAFGIQCGLFHLPALQAGSAFRLFFTRALGGDGSGWAAVPMPQAVSPGNRKEGDEPIFAVV